MKDKYIHNEVESTAQIHWEKIRAYFTNEYKNKKKFYCVSMLPYPSGKLHMGHLRNYTINDVIYRYIRMQGYNVLMPMGWDAFGMPAENAAIANGMPPSYWTYNNIAYMKKQMQSIGLSIDWSREISTCNPNYYKWNQWLFLKMLKKGIAYKKTGTVNWDPIDKTVLANEQVINGHGWRSGAIVEKKEIPMYYLRLTSYADQLNDDLQSLSWPNQVKIMQTNWIGKKVGVNLNFSFFIKNKLYQLKIFTTRVDIIMGVTFIGISTQHPIAVKLAKKRPALQNFINEYERNNNYEFNSITSEKKGIPTGFYVYHPITKESIEIWMCNYITMNHGEKIVMGVPAHNKNDFFFALRYSLSIRQVIEVKNKCFSNKIWHDWYADKNYSALINSGKYNGMDFITAIDTITTDLSLVGVAEKKIAYRIHDWAISRQRYWGTPIPIIHCNNCGDVPVPEKDLPVLLPENLIPDGTGNPLAQALDFINTNCPNCNAIAYRETDTMDTFVDSSWYFLRYTCPNALTIVDERTKYWMPIDQYIGGIEHAILHLLYSRFWIKVMYDLNLINFNEPIKKLLTQGMVLNKTFYCTDDNNQKKWLNFNEVFIQYDKNGSVISATTKLNGESVKIGALEKMSKSKNNGIDPQDLINKYGADTLRLFIIFAAPLQQHLEWSNNGVEGAARFLRRLWTFGFMQKDILKNQDKKQITLPLSKWQKKFNFEFNYLLNKVNLDYQNLHYNTIVSSAMKMFNMIENNLNDFLNSLELGKKLIHEYYGIILRILYPIIPHITYVLWNELNYVKNFGNLLDTSWPIVDKKSLQIETEKLILQINGKTRGIIIVPSKSSMSIIEDISLKHEIVKKYSNGNNPKKIIIIPNRVVNIII